MSARGVDGLPDGVHWYDPVGHALLQVGPPAGGEATTLVVTGIPWRTGWRYSERGFRHIYWDSGTMLAQTLALAPGRLFTTFPDAQVTGLVGADGVHEFPVALVALEAGAPAIEPGGAAVAGTIDAHPVEFPLVTAAQRAGDGDVLGEPWPARARPRPAGSAGARPRRGHPPARLDAADGRRGHAPARRRRVLARRRPARDRRAALRRRARRRGGRAGPVPLAGPDHAAAAREPAPGAAAGLLGPGPGPRRRLRGDGRDRHLRARRPRLPRRAARRAGSPRAACISPPTRSATARRG